MRILLWHGYLLGGTGSNVYTRALAREWSRSGHDVVVVSQEGDPELFDLGGARTVRPDIGGLLPVFVLDRYTGLEAKLLQDTSDVERARFVAANAAVLRELAPADLVFANHVLLGAPVGAASGLPFAVKHKDASWSTDACNDELSGGREASHKRARVAARRLRNVLEGSSSTSTRLRVPRSSTSRTSGRTPGEASAPRRQAVSTCPSVERNERLPTMATLSGSPRSGRAISRRLYFGKLSAKRIHLCRALRRVGSAVRDRRLRRLPRPLEHGRTDTLFTGPSNTGTSSTYRCRRHRRPVDFPSVEWSRGCRLRVLCRSSPATRPR